MKISSLLKVSILAGICHANQLLGQNCFKLDTLNGFKEYKLGSTLKSDSAKTVASDFFNEFSNNAYPNASIAKYSFTSITPNNLTIGGLKVLNIHLTTFNNKIIRVIVNTEPSDLMNKVIKESFGIPQECDNYIDGDPIIRRSEACIWSGKHVKLRYCKYVPLKGPVSSKIPEPWMKNGFNSLEFTSSLTLSLINTELTQKVKEASKDF